ncbi:hypothetical protein OpiT1DRAFT_04009 [Opitutaceae bacterium TAV1]|nr:hypothetical protein OpiT1DRAFT_04009 [Opitutaceae bacterium TAV1]
MNTPRHYNSSTGFDPDEIRRLIQVGKSRGLIRAPGEAAAIEKKGAPIAAEAGLRSLWMEVDPATATKWLENNFRNRRVSDDVVTAYARDMVNGVWIPTHQGIAFNDRDELIDGQHRLRAIVSSGRTIRMMVTFGLPSVIEGSEMTTMDAVDRGRTRSVADQLKIQHGFKDGAITAAVCMSLAGLCYGERTRRLSVGQTLEVFRAFEGAITWLILHRVKTHGLKAAGVLAGFAFAMATESEGLWDGTTAIQQMYGQMVSGEGLREGAPMMALRAFLTSDEARLLTRGTDRGVAELVLYAIRLEQAGKRVTKLEMSLDGVNHYRALQPDRVAKIAAMFRLPEIGK